MKRDSEPSTTAALPTELLCHSAAAEAFFALDTVVHALLDGECSVCLVALLLRLSRRMRRQVWNYFRAPQRYCDDKEFLLAFCADLMNYKERRQESKTFYNLYPCFALSFSTADTKVPAFRVARVVAYPLSHERVVVLMPGFYKRTGDETTVAHPSYDCDGVAKSVLFDWYLVADAICGAFDYMISINNADKWNPVAVTCVHDKDLLLCAL